MPESRNHANIVHSFTEKFKNKLYYSLLAKSQELVAMSHKPSVCLNIGCGNNIRPHWINLDFSPQDERVYKFDLSSKDDLHRLGDYGNVARISINHVIGYLSPLELKYALKMLYKILEPRGLISIESPCLLKLSKAFIGWHDDSDISRAINYLEITRGFYARSYKDYYLISKIMSQPYQILYSPKTLGILLQEIGIDNYRFTKPITRRNSDDRDIRCVIIKSHDS
jgi:hypothetical protein